MKKQIHILSLALAALSLVQCGFREQEAPKATAAGSFEIFAAPGETKTVGDGLSTRWEQDDPVFAFHAKAGTTTYVSDGIFVVDDPATGHALGTVEELESGLYDWYLFYPGTDQAPAAPGGKATIASLQTQNGNDSPAHLAGPGFPLGGKAERVAFDAVPSVTLHPLAAALKVHVTNLQERTCRIKEVSFTAPEAIAGSFSVSWDGVFSAGDAQAAQTVCTSVSEGALLAQDGTADVYMGIKPFQAASGATLTLKVTMVDESGTEATQEKSVTLPAATSFTSGLVKTLNFGFTEAFPAAKEYRFRQVERVSSGHHYLMVATYNEVNYAGMFFDASVSSGRMNVRTVTPSEGIITLTDTDGAFKFVESESGWAITQMDGRYLYNNNVDNIGVGDSPVAAGMYWTISFDANGGAAIVNRTRQFKFNTTSSVMKFQTRQTSSSGLLPTLWELLDDELIIDEFASREKFGFYSLEGKNYLYTEGTDQLSVRARSTGVAFRLLQPATYTAYQVTGIPANPAVGDQFNVEIKQFVKLVAGISLNLQVKVVRVDGDRVWLLADDGTGVLAKIR